METRYRRSAARLALLVAGLALGGVACTSASPSCPAGTTACGSGCVDIRSDLFNCGACNVACTAGATCVGGTCLCPAATPDVCGVSCVDKQVDSANCGTCGHNCGSGHCSGGLCSCDGDPSQVMLCPADPATGTCVDVTSNPYNCGACGKVCGPGFYCGSSTCQCAGTQCTSGGVTVCTDTATDPANCGGCGIRCATGQVCSNSLCVDSCSGGRTWCSGSCVDTATDPANCGSCGHSCGPLSCVGGQCAAACTTERCPSGTGTCCAAPIGSGCCSGGATCPAQHKNFPKTTKEQVYWDCVPSYTYDVDTALKAASVWAGGTGSQIATQRFCPAVGGSSCVVWQARTGLGTVTGCGVFCYTGTLVGAAAVTTTSACDCPPLPGSDWY